MKKELVQNFPIPRLPFLPNSILPFTIVGGGDETIENPYTVKLN